VASCLPVDLGGRVCRVAADVVAYGTEAVEVDPDFDGDFDILNSIFRP
jgi:hypothetical protein